MRLVQAFKVATLGGICLCMLYLLICKWKKKIYLVKNQKSLSAFLPLGRACALSFQGHFPSLLVALPLKAFGFFKVHIEFWRRCIMNWEEEKFPVFPISLLDSGFLSILKGNCNYEVGNTNGLTRILVVRNLRQFSDLDLFSHRVIRFHLGKIALSILGSTCH